METALQLAPDPTSAAAAREFVQSTLSDWKCDELFDDARLVVTELVSNAIRHAGTELRVALELRSDAIRVAVTDGVDGAVSVRRGDPHHDIDGRGLRMVEHVADRWGIDSVEDGGKTVWAEWQLSKK